MQKRGCTMSKTYPAKRKNKLMQQRSLLSRLRSNGLYYVISALLLLIGVPLYQIAVLTPAGYSNAINAADANHFVAYLQWVNAHSDQFLLYRALLLLAFAFLFTQPFTLYRIIVAQELIGQIEEEQNEETAQDDTAVEASTTEQDESAALSEDGLPPYAWRGKGFAVIAAWSGFFGIIAYLIGISASTLYVLIASSGFTNRTPLPANFIMLNSTFSITANTAGIGLLALSTLFFGAIIARSGMRLWPGSWVAFAYLALAVAALLSGSAVAAFTGQSALTTPAILLFALWLLWLGIMLIRLKPE